MKDDWNKVGFQGSKITLKIVPKRLQKEDGDCPSYIGGVSYPNPMVIEIGEDDVAN